jgi:hypothetical protein
MSYHIAGIEEVVASVVSRQVDTALDTAGDRFSTYLDSPKGEALMDKFEGKVETALGNVAQKHKWDFVLAGISLAALTAVGVSKGSKLGSKGTQLAGIIAVAAALPLLLRKEAAPLPARRAPRRA